MSIKPPMGDYRACFIDRQRECHFHSPPTARLFFKLYKVPSERKAFNSNCGRVFFEEICLRSVKGDIKTFCKKSSWETANGGGYFCHSRKHTKLNPSGKAVIPFRSDGKKSIRFPFLDNFLSSTKVWLLSIGRIIIAPRLASLLLPMLLIKLPQKWPVARFIRVVLLVRPN